MYKYQGIVKIYKRFKKHFDFLKIKVTIINIIKDCKIYIRTKALQYKSYKEFQILFIFNKTWRSIILDFIVKLSKSKDFINNISYNNILVTIDCFIKYSKFISINKFHLIKDLTDIVIQEVINNHRLLEKFIIDRNTIFAL